MSRARASKVHFTRLDAETQTSWRRDVCFHVSVFLSGTNGAGRRVGQHDHRQDSWWQHGGSSGSPENGRGDTRGEQQACAEPGGAAACDSRHQGESVSETRAGYRVGHEPTCQIHGERLRGARDVCFSASMPPVTTTFLLYLLPRGVFCLLSILLSIFKHRVVNPQWWNKKS